MTVPGTHILARFFRHNAEEWSEEEGKPKPGAFGSFPISVWSANALNAKRHTINDVRKVGFPGSGVSLFTVNEYYQIARDAVKDAGGNCQINIDWEPNHVTPNLQTWAYAHADVQALVTSQPARRTFRQYLSLRCNRAIPPHT